MAASSSSHLTSLLIIAVVATVLLLTVPATAAPQLSETKAHFVQAVCGDLSPQQCRIKAGACHPGRALQIKDSVALKTCAEKNGIHLQQEVLDPVKTIDGILAVARASPNAFKATRNCFYTHLGLMRNGIVDVEVVKTLGRSYVQESNMDPSVKSAILGAIDTCPQPANDSLTDLGLCLAQTCVKAILTNA